MGSELQEDWIEEIEERESEQITGVVVEVIFWRIVHQVHKLFSSHIHYFMSVSSLDALHWCHWSTAGKKLEIQ